ncbi:flagellar biosynthesis/type III secretory pathway chaperone [Silvimonas terrae]|uniref:Flagellar biosynthesis/type III secretory pathway chaperone n=1 Tax=Silvimonas terrae TaxID=300266 RepID=A0A840RBK5_9NEIS|nr:flagellar protein FlgN [Silvimonas terrae]MBB5190307.1 flagellar biosynthesis/type III secretory pathway chaperone [Silvimonas terrae]
MVQTQSVIELIQNASSALAELLTLLHQEQDCLVNNRIDELGGLLQAKQSAANHTEQTTRLVETWFAEHGIATHQADVQRWFEANLPEGASAWNTLREQARQAAAINRSNGSLIDTRRQLVDGFVADLVQERNDGSQVYSDTGQLSSRPGSITRDKA